MTRNIFFNQFNTLTINGDITNHINAEQIQKSHEDHIHSLNKEIENLKHVIARIIKKGMILKNERVFVRFLTTKRDYKKYLNG